MNIDELYEKAQDLRNNGQVKEAIAAYHEVITTTDDRKLRGYAWQMIGVCQNMAGDQQEASRSYQEAIKIFTEVKANFDLGCAYRDLGSATANAGNYDEAISYLEKSIAELEKTNDAVSLGISQDKLGVVYLQKGDLKKAQEWMLKGLATMRTQGDWFMEMTGMLDLAKVYYNEKRYEEALPLLWAGIGLTYDHGDQEKQLRRFAQIYGLLAECYKSLGAEELSKKLEQKYQNYFTQLDPRAQEELKR